MNYWAVFVTRSVFGGEWSIQVPSIGNTVAAELGDVVKRTQELMTATLGSEDTNRHLMIWVNWEAAMEALEVTNG